MNQERAERLRISNITLSRKVHCLGSFFGYRPLLTLCVHGALLLGGTLVSLSWNHAQAEKKQGVSSAPAGMVWIPGGSFMMGSGDDSSRANEGPPHTVWVDGFWIDINTVTNADFERFVAATGYVTTAEKAPTWEELRKQLPPGAPKPDASVFVPGSMVFTPSDGPVDRSNMRNFWR